MLDGWRVRVAPHLDNQRLAGRRTHVHGEKRRIDRNGLPASPHGDELMLAIAAALHDHGSRLRWTEIHERQRRLRV